MRPLSDQTKCGFCHVELSPESGTGEIYVPIGSLDESGFIADAAHWSCFWSSPGREAMAREQFHAFGEYVDESAFLGRCYADDSVLVALFPDEEFSKIFIAFAETGSLVAVHLAGWNRLVADHEPIRRNLHPIEFDCLLHALPRIRTALPTVDVLLDAYDWDGKNEKAEAAETADPEAFEEEWDRLWSIASEGSGTQPPGDQEPPPIPS